MIFLSEALDQNEKSLSSFELTLSKYLPPYFTQHSFCCIETTITGHGEIKFMFLQRKKERKNEHTGWWRIQEQGKKNDIMNGCIRSPSFHYSFVKAYSDRASASTLAMTLGMGMGAIFQRQRHSERAN